MSLYLYLRTLWRENSAFTLEFTQRYKKYLDKDEYFAYHLNYGQIRKELQKQYLVCLVNSRRNT
jgi:hypothetical protein